MEILRREPGTQNNEGREGRGAQARGSGVGKSADGSDVSFEREQG